MAKTPITIVYVLASMTFIIWCSVFNSAAVMLPFKLSAPDIVTKSFSTAPWLVSVTVTVVVPALVSLADVDAENVMLLVEFFLTGVISDKVVPSSI